MSAFSPTFPTLLGGQISTWEGAFSPSEVDRIVALGDAQALQRAQLILADDPYGKKRITDIAWLTKATAPDGPWLFTRLRQVAEQLNSQYYKYDLYPDFHEALQYTVYNAGTGGHFDWHVDHGAVGLPPRKISISVQLSAPADYAGCELEFSFGDGIVKGPRNPGTVIAFPSYMLHRVTPITAGVRKSLVAWVSGPDFR